MAWTGGSVAEAAPYRTVLCFVPLLFLEGVSSILFRQLSIVVCFSLAMSLFVAVTLVPVLCSRLLVLPAPDCSRWQPESASARDAAMIISTFMDPP